MGEGWKQVWGDIRGALRRASQAEEERISGAGDPPPSSSPSPAPPGTAEDLIPAPPVIESLPSHPTAPRFWRGRWFPVVLIAGLTGVVALFLALGRWRETVPPAPDVVATYSGGRITIEDVRQHLALLVPDKSMQRQLQGVQAYRSIVEEMITDELVRRWAAGRNPDRDKDFQHVMKHITEEINLDELHAQLHQGQMGVTESDIRAFYDANRKQFRDQTLTQARDQIRTTLQRERESRFVQDYRNRLKENATITRDFPLLEVPEPEQRELDAYYETNRKLYIVPAQAMVDEIRVAVGGDEGAAREKASKALTKLRAGGEFAAVARDLSETPFSEQGITVRKGERDPAYDGAVFALDPGRTSEVIRAGDAFYVVRLRSLQPERQPGLDEVRDQVRAAVLAQKEDVWFQKQTDRTLFTIRGQRYTVGEFWKEYRELPPAFLAGYQGVRGRQALAERLIERLLLVQDSYSRLLDVKNKDQIQETRLKVLAQMLDQEEVDDKIKITDEELSAYYQDHKAELVEPSQVKIRYIAVRLGQTQDESKRAWEKANKAYKKLVPGLLQKGAEFAEVAREYSEDPATASKGGDLDRWFKEGPDLLAEAIEHPLHEQILRLRPMEISRPFEWSGGIYIVQAKERREPKALTFEETKDLLREELRQKKHDELAGELSRKLLKQARVTIYERTLQAMARDQSQTDRR